MTRIATILGAFALLALLAGAGIFFYVKSIDPNQYKGYVSRKVKAATGREIKLEGPISLSIGWNTALVVEGASFANASWGARPEMVKLKRLEVEMDLWPLIRSREIQVKRLVLIQPDIFFETDKRGRGNWELDKPGAEEEGEGGGVPPSLSLDFRMEDGLITYRDGKTGEIRQLAIERMTSGAQAIGTPLALDLKGTYRLDFEGIRKEIPVRMEGEVGPLRRILQASRQDGGPFPVDLRFTFGDIESTVKGQVADIGKMSGIDLRFSAKGGGLADVQTAVGRAIGTRGKFSFAAEVKGDRAVVILNELWLTSGESDISGRLKADLKGKRPRISGELRSGRLALTEMRVEEGGKKPEPGAAEAAKGLEERNSLYPGAPLPTNSLKALDADVRYSAGEIVAPRAFFRDVRAHAVLRDGKLVIRPLTAKTAGGTARGDLMLDGTSNTVSIRMKAKDLDTTELQKNAGRGVWMTGKADLEMDLVGRGKTVPAVMGTLNGETRVTMSHGSVHTAGIDYVIGGFTQVLGTLLSRDFGDMNLNCAAADFVVKDGVATSRALVADSNFSTIAGEGNVNLGRETLAMQITPKPKIATLNISVPVDINGTFQNPRVQPNAFAVARRLGGIIGAFVFPPAALLALGDLGTWDNPCLQILKGEGVPETPKEKAPDSIAGTAAQGIQKGVEGIGKGLKGLFGGR